MEGDKGRYRPSALKRHFYHSHYASEPILRSRCAEMFPRGRFTSKNLAVLHMEMATRAMPIEAPQELKGIHFSGLNRLTDLPVQSPIVADLCFTFYSPMNVFLSSKRCYLRASRWRFQFFFLHNTFLGRCRNAVTKFSPCHCFKKKAENKAT